MQTPAEQINQIVDNVVEKLGPLGEKGLDLSEIIVVQYQTSQLVYAIGSFVVFLSLLMLSKYIISIIYKSEDTCDEDKMICKVITLVATAICCIIAFFQVFSGIQGFCSPVYYLLKDVIL